MKARMLAEADYTACMALACEANAEGRYSRYELNMAKVESLFNLALHGRDFFCVVVEHEGTVVALMYGVVTEHFYSNMRYATNVMFYVSPAHRGSWAAVRMLKMFEQEAVARGADELLIGAANDFKSARTISLFHALGYQPVGANCVKYCGG